MEVLTLIGPIGLLTALLYYFGYVSARAYYAHFGITLSALNFSTTHYLLRGPDTLFRPVAVVLLAALAAGVAHLLLRRALQAVTPGWALAIAVVIVAVGAALLVLGVLGLIDVVPEAVAALALSLSALVIEYGLGVARRYAYLSPRNRELLETGVLQRRVLLGALVVIGTFWAVTDLAQERGAAAARVVELSLRLQPQVVVYSKDDLRLPGGTGIGVTPLTDPNAEKTNPNAEKKEGGYNFRYNGLRPLLYANGRWFLLPVGWTRDNGATVIVLPDGHAGSRVDMAPSPPAG
jgi:hypothetical protein